MFNPNRHEPGTKKVMGAKIKENGEMEGRELLHMLATRPATAQFISRKLAIRFVSDDPPQALVDRMAKTYLSSGGDIPSRAEDALPFAGVLGRKRLPRQGQDAARICRLAPCAPATRTSTTMQPLVNALRQMGMPLYGCVPPTGYKWDAADWVSTGALVDRMNFALSLAANRLPGITVDWAPELDMSALDNDDAPKQVVPTPESEEARLEPLLVAGRRERRHARGGAQRISGAERAESRRSATPMDCRTRARRSNRAPAADAYEREDQLLAGLLLGSPEFQRR